MGESRENPAPMNSKVTNDGTYHLEIMKAENNEDYKVPLIYEIWLITNDKLNTFLFLNLFYTLKRFFLL